MYTAERRLSGAHICGDNALKICPGIQQSVLRDLTIKWPEANLFVNCFSRIPFFLSFFHVLQRNVSLRKQFLRQETFLSLNLKLKFYVYVTFNEAQIKFFESCLLGSKLCKFHKRNFEILFLLFVRI